MTAHVKQWLMLRQRCFDGSELLVALCSFHLTSVLHFVSPIKHEPQERTPLKITHNL